MYSSLVTNGLVFFLGAGDSNFLILSFSLLRGLDLRISKLSIFAGNDMDSFGILLSFSFWFY